MAPARYLVRKKIYFVQSFSTDYLRWQGLGHNKSMLTTEAGNMAPREERDWLHYTCKVGEELPSQIVEGFGDGDRCVIHIPSKHGLERQ